MAATTHEREVVLDEPTLFDEQAEAVRKATERAELAEAELAKLKHASAHKAAAASASVSDATLKDPPSPSSARAAGSDPEGEINLADESAESANTTGTDLGGEAELRKDSMMAHLLDSLEAGKDIGHYGRLVFAMVARHFMPHEEVIAWMVKDKDDTPEKAQVLLRQVEGKDYNPPRRDKILYYQSQQEFPILPNPDDPDCGNLYRNLKFPTEIYDHISHYQEAKMDAN